MRDDLFDRLFGIITWMGSLIVLAPMAVATLVWLMVRKRYAEALGVAVSSIDLIVTLYVTKWIVARERPSWFGSVVDLPSDYSFPSAHTAQAFLAALIAGSLMGKWAGMVALSIACMVALSRLYLQVHYPSDIVGGILVAIFWGGVGFIVYQRSRM